MPRCEGTTRSGNRCKLDARPDSLFCHLHDQSEKSGGGGATSAEEEAAEFGDLIPLVVAGAVVAGFLFLFRSFGRWIPRF